MKRLVSTIAAGVLAALMSTSLATAQTPTPSSPPAAQPKAPPAAAAKKVEAKTGAKAPAKPRTAESIACSAEADKKKLHGKERKTFRAKCIRDMKKSASAKGTPAKAAAPASPPAAKTK
jgi:hypothetical protein